MKYTIITYNRWRSDAPPTCIGVFDTREEAEKWVAENDLHMPVIVELLP